MLLPLRPGRYRTRNGRLAHVVKIHPEKLEAGILAEGRLDGVPRHCTLYWWVDSGRCAGRKGRQCWDLIARVGGRPPMITGDMVKQWLSRP